MTAGVVRGLAGPRSTPVDIVRPTLGSESKRIAVFGAGYVGLVTGACFADLGHEVVVRDVDESKIAALEAGRTPIFEPGLSELLERNRDRLRFTLDVGEAVEGADFVYVAVGTPPTYSGDADLSAVWTVVDELPAVKSRIVVVTKSTVPVGTGAKIRHRLDERGLTGVGYASNPEFTAEGTAVRDFMRPDRIVVGAFAEGDGQAVAALHAGIDAPVVHCDVASAEMIKLAANAALMTRISFINEIANVCEATGADVVKVAEGIGLDRRVGPGFLRAGIGFGGSCLLGEERVTVDVDGDVSFPTLEELFDEACSAASVDAVTRPDQMRVLAWVPGDEQASFHLLETLTRRWFEGEVVHVRNPLAGRIVCTSDHPFVVRGREGDLAIRVAGDLREGDLLPHVNDWNEWRATRTREGSAPVATLERLDVSFVSVHRLERRSFSGWVYSLEVPDAHTFVTTGGLVVHNCFPKDSLALKQLAANSGYHFQLLAAVIEVNELQKRRVLAKLERHLGSLRGKTIALLGLAFKPNTDDMREAPSLVLAGRLHAEGATVRAWDPIARPSGLGVEQVDTVEEALAGADAAVLVTEWPELADVDWAAAAAVTRRAVFVDGRNMLDPQTMRDHGWTYEAVGRAAEGAAVTES